MDEEDFWKKNAEINYRRYLKDNLRNILVMGKVYFQLTIKYIV